jgi:leucine dehydrogenase
MAVVERRTHDAVLLESYEQVSVRTGPRSGLTMVVAIHRTVAGRSLGGCRIWSYATADDAVREAERLARSMTLKAAVAGLRLGGAKAVISTLEGEPLAGQSRQDALRDFAELVDSLGGRYVTAQDVGTSADDVAFMARYTDHVAGRPISEGGCGDPSRFTAHGVEVGIRVSLGGGSLSGREIVIVGLGHVGGELAVRLQRAGALLTVTDMDPAKRALAERLGARWVPAAQALDVEADVLAPCALGGMLDAAAIERLRVPVVAGAANNQLSDDDVADLLRERDILWAPDFVINAGGLIAVADELHGFQKPRAERAIEQIGDTLTEILTRARTAGTSTLVAARELAAERRAAE